MGRRPGLVVQPRLCSYRGSPAGVEEGVADLLTCCFWFCLQIGQVGTAWLADTIGVTPKKSAPRQQQRWGELEEASCAALLLGVVHFPPRAEIPPEGLWL